MLRACGTESGHRAHVCGGEEICTITLASTALQTLQCSIFSAHPCGSQSCLTSGTSSALDKSTMLAEDSSRTSVPVGLPLQWRQPRHRQTCCCRGAAASAPGGASPAPSPHGRPGWSIPHSGTPAPVVPSAEKQRASRTQVTGLSIVLMCQHTLTQALYQHRKAHRAQRLCEDRLPGVTWLSIAAAHALTPFSPRALSLRSNSLVAYPETYETCWNLQRHASLGLQQTPRHARQSRVRKCLSAAGKHPENISQKGLAASPMYASQQHRSAPANWVQLGWGRT